MVTQGLQQLSDDHQAVGELLTQLLTALSNNDLQVSYSMLDLLWARLAVHIRAEHLHLFPVMKKRLTESGDLASAKSMVECLRSDHEFFMRELAGALETLRAGKSDLNAVGDTIREIEKRLEIHNELEEKQIYCWTTTILTQPEQKELATQIDAELEKRPPRFSAETWTNK